MSLQSMLDSNLNSIPILAREVATVMRLDVLESQDGTFLYGSTKYGTKLLWVPAQYAILLSYGPRSNMSYQTSSESFKNSLNEDS